MITRDDRGVFEAWLADGRFVRGWASTVEEMAAILRRYGETAPDLAAATVSTVVAAADLDNLCAGKLYDHSEEWDDRLRAAADGSQRVMLREKLIQLRSRVPADPEQLRSWLGELTDQVNAVAPQVKEVSVFDRPGAVAYERSEELEAASECLVWVDPSAILSTPDPVWGAFDRMEPNRRSLEGFCTSLRSADSARRLESWIDDFVVGQLRQPVQLVRVEGPGGPVYELRADGTHRAHFARIFELPLLAVVRTSRAFKPLFVIDHPRIDGVDRFGRWASLWTGLREHGLLEVAGDPEPAWLSKWTPTWICAEWMLLPPVAATAANRAYDRAHPGTLQAATGLADSVLFDERAWACQFLREGPAVTDSPTTASTPRAPRGWSPERASAPGGGPRSLRERLRRWVGR